MGELYLRENGVMNRREKASKDQRDAGAPNASTGLEKFEDTENRDRRSR